MRRRAVLRAGLGLVGLASAGAVGAIGEPDRRGAGPPSRGAGSGDDGAAYAPLNRIELPGTSDCRVADGGEAAFAAVDDGFAAVALHSLEPLAEVREIEPDREHGPLAGVADLAVDGDRLLVPGPANARRDQLAGFALFDVADPADPVQVAFHPVNSSIHNAALADGRAYLTDGLFLTVVDVTDDDPVELGSWSLVQADSTWGDVPPVLRILHDVRVRDDLTYLSQWDAGTFIVDATDPEDVAVVGRAGGRSAEELATLSDDAVRRAFTEPPGNHHSTALSDDGSLLAIGAEAFDAEAGDGRGGPGGLDLYDVTDPSSPSHLASIDPPRAADETHDGTWTTAHDFAFAGDRLLSAWYQGGVKVHDVSDPTAPAELAWWRRPDEAAFWTALPVDGESFVASSTALPGGDLFPGLYRFPNRPGEQADPPPLTETASPTPSPTPSPARTPTPSPSPTPTATPTASSSPTRTPGQPGLGVFAALGGLGGWAAWRRWRRRR